MGCGPRAYKGGAHTAQDNSTPQAEELPSTCGLPTGRKGLDLRQALHAPYVTVHAYKCNVVLAGRRSHRRTCVHECSARAKEQQGSNSCSSTSSSRYDHSKASRSSFAVLAPPRCTAAHASNTCGGRRLLLGSRRPVGTVMVCSQTLLHRSGCAWAPVGQAPAPLVQLQMVLWLGKQALQVSC